MEKEGKYIYCIIALRKPKTFGRMGIGNRGDEVSTICSDGISAVVSNSPIIQYSVSRENTLSHERAIEEVMKEHTVLPVRFGTVAEDEEKVRGILKREHDRFKDLLNQLNGKKELGLKAIFKEDIVYKDILETYEDIRLLKEKVAKLPPEKTYYQRMEIGRKVAEALEKEKEKYKAQILDTLRPMAEDLKINNNYGERMIINAAFLVNEDKESEFDQRLRDLDGKYGDKIKFKYIGTVPPFNFVNLIIETWKY